MTEIFKQLPNTINPKGTGIQGLTAQLVRRTKQVAWYVRNDGYHEVFLIKSGQTFDGRGLMEYYPGTDAFGISAWCTRSEETAAKLYANLCLGGSLNQRSEIKKHEDNTERQERKIRRPQIQIYVV